jgi:hypothetical protein
MTEHIEGDLGLHAVRRGVPLSTVNLAPQVKEEQVEHFEGQVCLKMLVWQQYFINQENEIKGSGSWSVVESSSRG